MDKKHYTAEQQNEKMQQNKFWLQNSVNEIIEPMMLSVVMQQQSNSGQSFDQVSHHCTSHSMHILCQSVYHQLRQDLNEIPQTYI